MQIQDRTLKAKGVALGTAAFDYEATPVFVRRRNVSMVAKDEKARTGSSIIVKNGGVVS